MDQVKKYIETQKNIIEKAKEKKLIEIGLTEKEYAPDNRRSYIYDMYEEVDDEKRYYRIVAAKVTDEEYAEILENDKQIDQIFAKEKEKAQNANAINSDKDEKTWVPVYELPVEEKNGTTAERYAQGKSTCAAILRVVAWIILIIAGIMGIIMGANADEGRIIFVCIGSGLLNMLFFYALAEILDRLAELTAIARNGIKYKVDKK